MVGLGLRGSLILRRDRPGLASLTPPITQLTPQMALSVVDILRGSLALTPQMSRNRTSLALRWMNERLDSTSSPISTEKISSAAAASSRVTWSNVR